jgi:citrate synthase
VAEKLEKGEKIPGFGHRIYKDQDPRAQLILSKLEEGNEFMRVAKDMEAELEKQTGKQLPLNIDGAIAVVLCSWGWGARLGKALFIIARTPGLCGHYLNALK